MENQNEYDPLAGQLYLAGERVPSGIYKQIGSHREIALEKEDFLPASLDGRVACYIRVPYTWAQMQKQHQERSFQAA